MFEEKVSPEVARQEVEGWLDFKKVSPKKREEQKESIDTLVQGVVFGTLNIDEKKNIIHTLVFPIESDGVQTVTTLTYKPRITAKAISHRMKGVKMTDIDARIMAYAAALTGNPIAVLGELDTEDLSIAQAVVGFFM